MRQTSYLLKSILKLKLQDRYELIGTCPKPSITSSNTYCECEFPPDKQINYEKPLLNTKAAHWKHVLVHSKVPANEWSSKVELMPDQVISIMSQYKRKIIDPMHPVLISNIELDYPDHIELEECESLALVYPNNEYYKIKESNVQSFMKEVLTPKSSEITNFKPITNKNPTILICGHTKRDIRCGILGPMLKAEFEYNLKDRKLLYDPIANPAGIKVGLVSHIGGHAYAGNVIYFDKYGLNIWYGRIKNDLVDAIIQETILNNNIIKEYYRGHY